MPQSTETIEQLRARLAGMKKGPARIEPLGNLAQKLFQRMMTAPLESPGTRADLDEAIECAGEIYEYHQDGDPQRPQVAAFLGYMLTFRSFHVQDTSGRERAMELLDEAIAYERFPVPYLAMLRVLLARGDARRRPRRAAPADRARDLRGVEGCLRHGGGAAADMRTDEGIARLGNPADGPVRDAGSVLPAHRPAGTLQHGRLGHLRDDAQRAGARGGSARHPAGRNTGDHHGGQQRAEYGHPAREGPGRGPAAPADAE